VRRLLVVLALVTACGGPGDDERPGSAAVYDEIETSADCAALQETFDRASANHDRAQPGSAERRWTRGYMRAADDRMRSIGCY
jgi:hypothetical protein